VHPEIRKIIQTLPCNVSYGIIVPFTGNHYFPKIGRAGVKKLLLP
jgi:hypothetical protein